jgi:GntR family transcriptional regulator, uxu operon transcriptional repressor
VASPLPKPVLRSFEAVAQKITSLVQAEYEIGQRLPSERAMAQQFGVSRPTIREAVLSLVLAGVLEVRHNSGVYVVGATGLRGVQALEGFGPFENLAARRLVEPPLAATAARQPSERTLADLAKSLVGMRRAHADGQEADVFDHRFHMIIAEASGNGALAAVCDMLWRGQIESRIWREIHVHMPMAAYRPMWLADHERIYEAIRDQSKRKASAAMALHLDHIRDALMQSSRPGSAK